MRITDYESIVHNYLLRTIRGLNIKLTKIIKLRKKYTNYRTKFVCSSYLIKKAKTIRINMLHDLVWDNYFVNIPLHITNPQSRYSPLLEIWADWVKFDFYYWDKVMNKVSWMYDSCTVNIFYYTIVSQFIFKILLLYST